MNTTLFIFAFVSFFVFLGFIYLSNSAYIKAIKFLIEKLVAIKTFSAGMPIEETIPVDTPFVPQFFDDYFGEGEITEEEFDEDLKPGDEIDDAIE